MSILNEHESLSEKDSGTFIRGTVDRVMLQSGHKLYKFTSFPLIDSRTGGVTSWWSSVSPVGPGDDGLVGFMRRSGALARQHGVGPRDVARARSAVSIPWNDMTDLLHVELTQPAYAWVGRCSGQLYNDEEPQLKNVFFIGGAWQVCLPNLKPQHVRQLPPPVV